MRKILLMMFVAVSTLTGCNGEKNDAQSFSSQILDVKGYDETGDYVKMGYNKAVNPLSKFIYDESAKTITVFINENASTVYKVLSYKDNVFKTKTSSLGDSPLDVEFTLKNGNYIATYSSSGRVIGEIEIILSKS